ncbi:MULTISPECIES: GntR family transcriptional regulator [unclassified Streptomyces]|uniref:GntR family transcriptional regulator n=1 Tax=unclassified Streptomyces TaxID=2593676 RepID=UPI0022503D99|nr:MULTISPECIES: GntR family transcriptional regulator [unclassified Streptomyces]MCX4871085.1 GntR family transcriptional regulator [Streptomyces sp. NBC_00906]MCX4902687.1 GntR family transcriptional regulator [Streptomyces sp. NBC_00892]
MAYKSPGKGYADVASHFRARIKSGELAPGDALPSVAEIRDEFEVAAKTVSRALGVLKSEGLVTSRGSLGTVVAKSPIVITGTDRLDRMARNGLRYAPGETSTGHSVMRRSIRDADVCRALDLEPGDEAIIRIRVFQQDGRPTSVGVSVYPPHTVAKVPELAEDVRMVRQFDELYTERTGREVVKGQRTAHARQASQNELDALEIEVPPHTAVAVLVTTVTFHDDDRPLGYWEDVYAPGARVPISD